jgi:hypothetical protein
MPALGASYLGETYLGGLGYIGGTEIPTGLTLLINSALSEFVAKQGDNAPAWPDTLTWSDGTPVDLQGCTVQFVLRNLASSAPVELTGETEIVNALQGKVLYYPSSQDTAVAGEYMACWIVTFPNGRRETAPTEGYREVRIEPSLTTGVQQLVGLTEVKNYPGVRIPADDFKHDQTLLGYIDAVRSLIEFETGPIIPQFFDEWHDGGHSWITLRHRPRVIPGMTPLLRLAACSEYNGPIEWSLAIISSPDQGQLYSCMVDPQLGRVVRRTAGGGTQPFPNQPQAVHVIYEAGQEAIPANIRLAALEQIAHWHSTNQPIGKGFMRPDDEEGGRPAVGLLYSVLEKLKPTKRIKGIA